MSPVGQQKLAHVETIRGIACIMLVSYHVVGDTPANGLELPLDHPLSALNHLFVDMRMPLFSFISGLVFHAATAPSRTGIAGTLAAKARRLLLPMIVVGTLYWILQEITKGAERPYWSLYVLPFQHFWFLQATFLLMAAHLLATAALGGRDVKAAFILLGVSAALFVGLDRWRPDVFSSYKAAYLGCYFYAGYLAGHWPAAIEALGRGTTSGGRLLGAAALGAALVAAAAITTTPDGVMAAPLRDAAAVAIGLSVCLGLFLLRPVWAPLVWIGGYSYAIFLYHVFFTAGSRMVLRGLVDDVGPWPLFVAGTAAGLAGPVLLWHLFIRHRATALPFLGIDLRPRRRAPPSTSDGAALAH